MGQPIATVGSNHTCPMQDGPKPHVGGPLLQGSPTIFANGKPIGRVGDQLQCQSPSLDIITKGSVSVFADGKPIARMNDMTAHGGVIVKGELNICIG